MSMRGVGRSATPRKTSGARKRQPPPRTHVCEGVVSCDSAKSMILGLGQDWNPST
eukprot:CAMPEP_0198531032 /NCGR_PEP_ID=MMETSP1462-20131121/26704_1 /TAXON_ID=1333877 /ORGANISM="Brandtodinium nutriculum, Strain RCC3387" /LENGTH=54 /DNA_ID=CAMNT_0044260915 /DNA_START=18 /DNA_END=179 /DNA_ORIENTATION=+